MQTKQTEMEHIENENPCCEEQIVWKRFKHQINASARRILMVAALVDIGLFIMGLLFDPSVTRILWLSLSGLLLVVALPLIVFIGKWPKQCNAESATENSIENKIRNHE